MSTTRKRPKLTPLEQLAKDVQDTLMAHMNADTEEDDARREAERDARVAAALQRMAEEGNLPARKPPGENSSKK